MSAFLPALATLGLGGGSAQAGPSGATADSRLDSSGWVVHQRGGLAGVNPVLAGAVVFAAVLAVFLWRKGR